MFKNYKTMHIKIELYSFQEKIKKSPGIRKNTW